MIIPKEDLGYLQEKYADLLMNDANPVFSQEIPASDKYEHEMIRVETKRMRALRLGCASIAIIFSILFTIPFLSYILSPQLNIITLFFCLIFSYLSFLMLKGVIVYHLKIKLTITDLKLLSSSMQDRTLKTQ